MNTRLFLVGVLAVVYASCYSVIKAGLAFAPPLWFAGLRTVAGGAALLAYVFATDRVRWRLPPSRWPAVAALALVGTVALYGVMFMSPELTGAGLASVLGNTGPLFAVLLAVPILGEPVTGRKVGALVVGMGGAMLAAYPSVTDSATSGAFAALLPLAAAATAAGSAVLLKWLRLGEALLPVVGWQLLLGGGVLLGLSLLLERDGRVTWTPRFTAYLAFLALAGTAFASAAWYWLVQREDVGHLSILLMVPVPIMGLGLARLLFGEPIHPLSAVGAGLALVGVVLALSTPGEADAMAKSRHMDAAASSSGTLE